MLSRAVLRFINSHMAVKSSELQQGVAEAVSQCGDLQDIFRVPIILNLFTEEVAVFWAYCYGRILKALPEGEPVPSGKYSATTAFEFISQKYDLSLEEQIAPLFEDSDSESGDEASEAASDAASSDAESDS